MKQNRSPIIYSFLFFQVFLLLSISSMAQNLSPQETLPNGRVVMRELYQQDAIRYVWARESAASHPLGLTQMYICKIDDNKGETTDFVPFFFNRFVSRISFNSQDKNPIIQALFYEEEESSITLKLIELDFKKDQWVQLFDFPSRRGILKITCFQDARNYLYLYPIEEKGTYNNRYGIDMADCIQGQSRNLVEYTKVTKDPTSSRALMSFEVYGDCLFYTQTLNPDEYQIGGRNETVMDSLRISSIVTGKEIEIAKRPLTDGVVYVEKGRLYWDSPIFINDVTNFVSLFD